MRASCLRAALWGARESTLWSPTHHLPAEQDLLDLFELVKICVRAHKNSRVSYVPLHAGSLPFKFSALKGPGAAINFRAASTCSHTFHSNTPRTRPCFR